MLMPFIATFLVLTIGQADPVHAQGSCQGIQWSVVKYEPCKYRLQATVTMDCYQEATLLVSTGAFSGIQVNDATGWQAEVIAPGEIHVTHSSGIFPNGSTWVLDFYWSDQPGSGGELVIQYPDLCTMEGCDAMFPLDACPGGEISGIVYRECNGLPLMNQPGWPDVIVQLEDGQGLLLQETTTDASGNYFFYDLPHGQYIVRGWDANGHWTASIPASGQYAMDLLPGQTEVRNFGICPICTCDDWEILLSQEPVQSDTAYINLAIIYRRDHPYCHYRVNMAIDSGEILGVTPPDGWEVEITDPLHAILTVSSDDWWNQMVPPALQARTAVGSATNPTANRMVVTIVGEGNAMPEAMCEDSIVIQDPTKYVEYTCCPDGKTAGPELVVDGNFVGPGLPASDYTPWVSGPITQGQVAIFDMNQAYAANNQWVTPGFFNIWDTYLAVDGHGTPNQAAWKQQVTGLTPGAEYQFCTLVSNLVSAQKNFDDPIIILEIVDDTNPVNTWQSAPLVVPESPKQWVPHSLSWTAPASTSYTLRILSTVQDAIGNDFALDRVSFRECITVPQDTCCKDLANFCADLDSLIVFDPDSCKVTMELGALPPCYTIEWVDWGQGPEFGPWTSSTFPYPMHVFNGNGTYPISYLAIAYNDSNFICLEKVMEDTITVLCNPCVCNDPAMYMVHNGISYQMTCQKGAPIFQLPCPAGEVVISGFFGCETATGELCEETVVNYILTGPNGVINSGSTTPFTNFIYPAVLIGAPGTYSLTLSTLCPGQIDSCLCTLQWLQQDCDTCYCGGFTDMYIRTHAGLMNQPVACGDSAVILPCPDPGKGFHLTGVFQCAGGGCPPDHQIDWTLVHQSTGTTHTGGFQDNDPYFGIHILPTYISQPGIYTLTMTGYCNGDTCECVIQFIIDCPDLCPCEIDDIIALSNNVNQGFAVALANKSCKACFSPLAVSDCETVEWYVGSTSGAPIGSSIGGQTFCYTFPFSGTYTIIMVVTRLKPDGSLCEVFTYSKPITVSCIKAPVCTESVWPNPGFSEGAIAGNMNMGGVVSGWVGEGEFPTVLEGVEGSDDAWSILLTGCYFNSDVLRSSEPICLSKTDTGTLSIRLRTPGDPVPGIPVLIGKPPPPRNLIIGLVNPQAAQPPFGLYPPEGKYLIVLRGFLALEDDDWYELSVPFDLSDWVSLDSCGEDPSGYPLHIVIGVSNLLSNDQGDGNIREAILIDQICMDGEPVSLDPAGSSGSYRVWPNPGRESIRLLLPEPALPGTRLRLVNLTGQPLVDGEAKVGQSEQTLDTSGLPPGMYFIVVERNGMARAILRWVCQD